MLTPTMRRTAKMTTNLHPSRTHVTLLSKVQSEKLRGGKTLPYLNALGYATKET